MFKELHQYNNLVFDLDDTFYNYASTHKIAVNNLISFLVNKTQFTNEEVLLAYNLGRKKTHIDLVNTGASHNRLLYVQKTLEILKLDSISLSLECYNAYWDVFLENITLFEGVKKLLETLKEKDKKICILTDLTAHIQFRKLKALGIEDKIDFMVTSEECGKEKPHPIMFFKALEKLNCGKEDAVMIGDNWKKDILGAKNMGISSIWINHENVDKQLESNIFQVNKFNDLNSLLC